jgi:hypothetical protein
VTNVSPDIIISEICVRASCKLDAARVAVVYRRFENVMLADYNRVAIYSPKQRLDLWASFF